MSIQKLSEAEKDFAISEIVEKGVVKPGDKFKKMLEVRRACSFHTLFFGVGDCFLLGFLIAACIWLLLIQAGSQVIICMVFAVSPFAYIASYLLTSWKEHRLQLYDIKMTCRYTVRQVSAFRMICFSGTNIFLNVLMLSLLMRFQLPAVAFWKILGLSFVAIFLYGIIMLVFQIKGMPHLTTILPPVLWGMINAFVIAFYGEKLETMLLNLAGSLVFTITVIAFSGYLIALFVFFISKAREEESYAIS